MNPTHEIAWSISEFFPLRGRVLRAGPPAPLCFLFFVFSHPPTTSNAQGRPLTERSKTRIASPEALPVLHCKHVASRMQCELIRIHIAWGFGESKNHCDLNQKALMVAFRLSRNKCQALVDPVHPDLCTLIAVYIDKATDTAHERAFRTSTILYTGRVAASHS